MHWSLWIIIIAGGLYLLHRIAQRLERDGWIRYLHHPPSAGDGGAASMSELQKFFEPQTRHVYEMRERKRPIREDESGEDK